jgi:hypothetical protein
LVLPKINKLIRGDNTIIEIDPTIPKKRITFLTLFNVYVKETSLLPSADATSLIALVLIPRLIIDPNKFNKLLRIEKIPIPTFPKKIAVNLVLAILISKVINWELPIVQVDLAIELKVFEFSELTLLFNRLN